MSLFAALRRRSRLVIGAAIAAALLLSCGALMILFYSPRQALLARRIDRMPDLDAPAIQAAPPGTELLVTGRLDDNPILDPGDFVAYTVQAWAVTPPAPDDDDGEPKGSWKTAENVGPRPHPARRRPDGAILRAENTPLSGALHEQLIYSEQPLAAEYEGQRLPHGTLRMQGLRDGDRVTVLGKKASTGGVIPDELYAGDRVAFADSKRSAARGFLIGGLCLSGLGPAVLVAGVLTALFGRRRRFR